jgi:methylmalonyl-CoA mutase C-terminal domain/subunit
MPRQFPIRVVLAKLGLDGHDRGIQVVARALRDAGMEVIYTGLWQTPRDVVRAVEDEDADVLGVSILSGAHLTTIPALLEALRERGLGDVPVVLGGIVPDLDAKQLEAGGVAKVFTPGTPLPSIVEFIRGIITEDKGTDG